MIYHCCPLKDNDLWERNVEQLVRRFHAFDGKAVVAVSTGANMHPVESVQRAFKPSRRFDIEFLPVPNDRRLREVASFGQLLEKAQGRDGCTFYAHTKGNSTYDSVLGATYWRNAMYHVLLDGWENCIRLLEKWPMVGTTKLIWTRDQRSPFPTELNVGRWMFAGTFFWFRNDVVFRKPNWRQVPNDRYGAEAWPSTMFEPHEVYSVFQPWPETRYGGFSMYDPEMYARAGMAIADIELEHPSYVI